MEEAQIIKILVDARFEKNVSDEDSDWWKGYDTGKQVGWQAVVEFFGRELYPDSDSEAIKFTEKCGIYK